MAPQSLRLSFLLREKTIGCKFVIFCLDNSKIAPRKGMLNPAVFDCVQQDNFPIAMHIYILTELEDNCNSK